MKKLLLMTTILVLASTAQARNDRVTGLQNGPYISGHAGFDHSEYSESGEKETDTRFAWDMAIGGRVRSFRFELQWANTTKAHIKDVHAEQQRYMAQFYYDLPFRSVIRPFLNAGIGAAYTDLSVKEDKTRSDDDTTFAWNVGGGLALNISSMISFDVGYRYIDAGKPKFFNDAATVKIRHHEGYAGVRFTF